MSKEFTPEDAIGYIRTLQNRLRNYITLLFYEGTSHFVERRKAHAGVGKIVSEQIEEIIREIGEKYL